MSDLEIPFPVDDEPEVQKLKRLPQNDRATVQTNRAGLRSQQIAPLQQSHQQRNARGTRVKRSVASTSCNPPLQQSEPGPLHETPLVQDCNDQTLHTPPSRNSGLGPSQAMRPLHELHSTPITSPALISTRMPLSQSNLELQSNPVVQANLEDSPNLEDDNDHDVQPNHDVQHNNHHDVQQSNDHSQSADTESQAIWRDKLLKLCKPKE